MSRKQSLPRGVLIDPGAHVSDFIECDKIMLPSGAILYRSGNKRALAVARKYGRNPNPLDLWRCANRVAQRHIEEIENSYARICAVIERGTNG